MLRRYVVLLVLVFVAVPLFGASLPEIDAAFKRSKESGYYAVPSGDSACDAVAETTIKVSPDDERVTVFHSPTDAPPSPCKMRIPLYEVAMYRSTWSAFDALESLRNADRAAWLVVVHDKAFVVRQFEFCPNGCSGSDQPVGSVPRQ